MNQTPALQNQAPEQLRSYEDHDQLYFEDYCRGLGDPDYHGYPGQQEGDDGRPIDPKPF